MYASIGCDSICIYVYRDDNYIQKFGLLCSILYAQEQELCSVYYTKLYTSLCV